MFMEGQSVTGLRKNFAGKGGLLGVVAQIVCDSAPRKTQSPAIMAKRV
jgi:hypothetical protein